MRRGRRAYKNERKMRESDKCTRMKKEDEHLRMRKKVRRKEEHTRTRKESLHKEEEEDKSTGIK